MAHQPERFDVLVVGGRIAGAATALLLSRRGLRVLVLERARRGADTLSTHALMRGGAALLQRWGLLERVAAAGTPPVRRTRFHYPGETTTVTIKAAAGVDALYAPRRTLLDALLIEAAIHAGAQVRFGVTVTDVIRDHNGRVRGVHARDENGDAVEYRGWLTVGADGARSLIASRVDAPIVRTGRSAGAVVYGYWPDLEVTGYEWFWRPLGTAGLIPTNDGEVCVFAGVPAHRFAGEFRGDLRGGYLRALKDATAADARLAEAEPPRRLRAFTGRPSFIRQAAGAGWALVGDAGQFVDPLSTHGMTDAMRDAHLLAQAVGAIVEGDADEPALAAYQARRDAIAAPLFAVVDQMASYEWDASGIKRLLLELNSAMSHELEAILGTDW